MTSTRPVLLLTRDDRLIASVGALAQDAGVRLTVAELPGAIPPPSAVLCGYDMPVAVAGEAAELNVPVAAVGFGRTPTDDGVPPVGPRYSLPQEAALLIAFLERSAGRTRTGLRVGFVGAHGGVGASSLAAATAELLVGCGRSVNLVDLDPGGGPLLTLLGIAQGSASDGWAQLLAALRTEGNDRDGEAMELAAEPEASLRDGISSIPGRFSPERPGGASAETGRATPGQATAEVDAGRGARGPVSINALPGLRFLGGSDRIEAGTPAHLVLRGLDAMEATRDPSVTLIDASRFGPVPLARLVHWCDRLVVVARTNAVGMVAVDSMEAALGQPTCPVTLVWRAGRGHLAPRIEAGWAAGVRDVIVLAEESGLRTPLGASQVAIARPRGAVAKCARELAATLGVPAAESRRSTLLKRWRTRENTPRPRRQSGAEHSPGLGGGEPLFGAAKDERDYTGDDPFKSSPIPLGGQRVRKADRPQGTRIGQWDAEW